MLSAGQTALFDLAQGAQPPNLRATGYRALVWSVRMCRAPSVYLGLTVTLLGVVLLLAVSLLSCSKSSMGQESVLPGYLGSLGMPRNSGS